MTGSAGDEQVELVARGIGSDGVGGEYGTPCTGGNGGVPLVDEDGAPLGGGGGVQGPGAGSGRGEDGVGTVDDARGGAVGAAVGAQKRGAVGLYAGAWSSHRGAGSGHGEYSGWGCG